MWSVAALLSALPGTQDGARKRDMNAVVVNRPQAVWSVRKSPLGHITKLLSSTFADTFPRSCTKQQVIPEGAGSVNPVFE